MSRKAVRQPRPKEKQPPKPNLPQHNLPAPYARLLTMGPGEFGKEYDAIAAELKQGDARAAVQKLVEMAQDESYYDYWSEQHPEDPRQWTRLHAVSVLSRMGEAAQAAIEPLLPLLGEEDDWLREEMPFFYAARGIPAIEPLTAVLTNHEADTYLRAGAGDALSEIAQAHPETRDEVIRRLEQALMAEQEDDSLAAFLIINLLDVGAKESVPLIRQAFEEGRVDEGIVQMADVEEHFGLPVTTPRKAWSDLFDEAEEAEEDWDLGEPGEMEAAPQESMQPYVAPPKVGRNEPCPCGSGKKYKKCCGA